MGVLAGNALVIYERVAIVCHARWNTLPQIKVVPGLAGFALQVLPVEIVPLAG